MRALFVLLVSAALHAPAQAQDIPAGPTAVADHIALNAADADVSAAFYKRTFGMTEIPTKLPRTRWLLMGDITLHIIGGRTMPVSPNRVVHFAVQTADLDKSIAYFDAHGIAWSDFTGQRRTIQTRFDGVRQVFIQDPDGYWVEVSDKRGKPQR
jgi:lactoylglutathione lyase